MNDYYSRFNGLSKLYGKSKLNLFKESHIAIIGLGGVGSWVVEALARSGIGKITLIDLDEVCLSNVNRQVQALSQTIGQSKCKALRERVFQIAPECKVITKEVFYTKNSSECILSDSYDYVVDAIDSVTNKIHLLAESKKKGFKIVTCGGGGGKIDPTKIKVEDLSRTRNDPLLSQVRKRLRKEYNFPKSNKNKFKIKCVFSDEKPLFPTIDGKTSCIREREKIIELIVKMVLVHQQHSLGQWVFLWLL